MIKININFSKTYFLGSLLFNIYIRDLFYFFEGTDIASYTDDTTSSNDNVTQQLVINEFEGTFSVLFKWFNNNYTKVNNNKSHFLISRNKAIANIDKNRIKPEDLHELFWITIDSMLIFETHINKFCKKASQKRS